MTTPAFQDDIHSADSASSETPRDLSGVVSSDDQQGQAAGGDACAPLAPNATPRTESPPEAPEHLEYFGDEEWVVPQPAAERVPVAWWRRLLGLPAPRKYRLGEVARHVWREHALWPQAWFHALIFVILSVAFWMMAMNYWVAVIDDAYITFRFSDHFIHGQGLAYTVGERVEGFTNFTWMVIIGVVIGLQGDPMFWAKTLGFVCCLLAMVGVAYFGSCFSRRRDPWNWMAAAPLAMSLHFAHWSMMGLETQLQVVLLVWTFARFYKEMHDPRAWNLSPLLGALAAMTRIESLYYMTPLAAYAVVQIARGRLDWRRFLRWGVWAAAFFIPYFVWKYTYFGDIAPNTYYAKKVYHESHERGIAHIVFWYFGQGAAFKNMWLIPLLMALLWARPVTLLILGPLVLNVFYVYHVDGDWMPNLRFFQVSIPFMGLLLLLGIRWVQQVLHDWREGGERRPAGRNGVMWIVAEAAVFGSWIWLLFIKARPVFGANKSDGSLVWTLALVSVAALLCMRWMSGWMAGRGEAVRIEEESREAAAGDGGGAAAGGGAARASQADQADRAAGIGGLGACPVPAGGGAGRRKGKFACVAWMGLEWAMFMAFGLVLAGFASQVGEVLTLAGHNWRITLFDFDLSGTAPAAKVEALSLSKYTVFYWMVGLLAAGWIVRLASNGRFARSLVRWPVYLGLAVFMALTAHAQLGMGNVYIFGRKPDVYPRNENSSRWPAVRQAMRSGFSPPLQNVADWILNNCQRDATIFMSDIGYPLWLNPHIGLIDVDGLVDKVVADAPSVRGNAKSAEEYIEEEIKGRKLAQPLSPERMRAIEEEAKRIAAERMRELAAKAEEKNATKAGEGQAAKSEAAGPGGAEARTPAAQDGDLQKMVEEIKNELVRQAKIEQSLPEDMRKHARSEGVRKYYEWRWKRAGRYVLQREPEYMNIFLSHTKQNDPTSQGWPYPDISREVYNSAEFKEKYVEVEAQNKYYASWNHYFRRKDVPVGIAPEEKVNRLIVGVRRNPRMSYLYRELATALMATGQPYEGEPKRLLHKAVAMFRGNEHFLNQVAQWGRQNNDDDLVMKAWNASLNANPKQDWLYRQICEYYISKDKFDEALEIAKKGISSPSYRSDIHLLGMLSRIADQAKQKKLPEITERAWALAVKAKPDQDWLYRRAADYYMEDNRVDTAISAVESGLPRIGGTGLHLHLAYLYDRAGRYDDAEKILLEAATKEPGNVRVYLDLGSLRGRHNKLEEAMEAYRKALTIDPNNAQAKGAIADLERRMGRASSGGKSPILREQVNELPAAPVIPVKPVIRNGETSHTLPVVKGTPVPKPAGPESQYGAKPVSAETRYGAGSR